VDDMLLKFTDDMEIVSGGDLTYAFYKKVNLNKDSSKFHAELGGFSLHLIIQHAKVNPKFSILMENYLDEK
jgi:hypothetical protein